MKQILPRSDRLVFTRHHRAALRLVYYAVAANGLLIISGTLVDQLVFNHIYLGFHRSLAALFGTQLVAGLGLLYLSSLLARRKQMAWVVAVMAYGFILGLNSLALFAVLERGGLAWPHLLRTVGVPLIVLMMLVFYRREFTVKSDIQGFRQSLGFIMVALVVAFIYGVAGFMLMDRHDFHQEISLASAIQHTIDQFGLTTVHQLVPYTRRARLFTKSLSVISLSALAYAAISLFQPIRAKFQNQTANRQVIAELLRKYKSDSESFFKLWPHDKFYIFNVAHSAALALHVKQGVALVVGDPIGNPRAFGTLLDNFLITCHQNDWRPAFINTSYEWLKFYLAHGLSAQKIGREAVVDVARFHQDVVGQKYFRQIKNKFTRLGYTSELLAPPHDSAVVERVMAISAEWLGRQNRAERGFMMGYASDAYFQQCPLLVARDQAGMIQAFVNQIESFDPAEANIDILRHAGGSPGNINDFLVMALLEALHGQTIKKLNLGLCPLSGLDDDTNGAPPERKLLASAMRLLYANGDRFYSFAGLERFKAKYQPDWRDRYIIYRGGTTGFLKTFRALSAAMKVKRRNIK